MMGSENKDVNKLKVSPKGTLVYRDTMPKLTDRSLGARVGLSNISSISAELRMCALVFPNFGFNSPTKYCEMALVGEPKS